MYRKDAEKEKKLAALREMIQNVEPAEAFVESDGQTAEVGTDEEPADDYDKDVMAVAVRLLGARDHGERELKRKLKTRGFKVDAIAGVLEACKRWGYIDDAQCCDRYFDELTARGYGSRRVRSTMSDKGFADDVIDQV